MFKEKLRKTNQRFGDKMMNKISQKQEQEELWKLVLEVRAKNGMTLSRMNRALERFGKTGMMPQ
jgi:hypothetical protein